MIVVRDGDGSVLCFGQAVGPFSCSYSLMKGEQTMKSAKAIPPGHHTVTPHLIIRGADQAIAFYKKAFGAQDVMRMPCPVSGKLMHAEIKIGDSFVYLAEEFPDMGGKSPQALGGTPVTLHIYVENVDAFFKRAVEAGAQVRHPLADMFWGDRFGQLTDPFGHIWSVASHLEDLTPEEMARRSQEFFANMPQPAGKC
jgi:uncharacterized glyoxalase superfamily protein PhnB